MNESADNDRLLSDILAEGTRPGFREALLGQTLRLARRRRRFRQARRGASVLAAVAGVVFLLWRSMPPTFPTQAETPYALVRTQPLLAAIVSTTPLGPGHLVSSAPAAEVVTTKAANPS